MIPKNIYRAWQTQTFHKKVEKRIKKTIRINKEYSHVIFTEPQRDDFVYANFEGSITEAYQQLNNVVAKVDLWRYLIIYKHGGVYLDMDASIERPISTFISDDDQAVISAETNENLFLQWALFYTKEEAMAKEKMKGMELGKGKPSCLHLLDTSLPNPRPLHQYSELTRLRHQAFLNQ